MKVTALEEYGLRCVLQLANEQDGTAMSADEIAHKEGLSGAYVQKILLKLCNAGLVNSVRGSHGGYRLDRSPDEISMGEVIRALDGSFFGELCTHFPGNIEQCVHMNCCGIRPTWLMIMEQVYDLMDRTMLSDLMMREERAQQKMQQRKMINSHPAIAAAG